MAAMTAKAQVQFAPNSGGKMIGVGATSANDGDTIVVSDLVKIMGCIGFSTTGVPASYSFATNVITVNNGGALTWMFIAWGY